ncbi:hypothetical protein pb186bvf_001959 [Paramecium bursaria]
MNLQNKKFIDKLRKIVDQNEGMCWSSQGDLIFLNDEQKLEQAMKKYFKTSKLTTFHRQLTYYQFFTFIHQNGQRAYKNPNFTRDNIELEQNIIRNKRTSFNLYQELLQTQTRQFNKLKEIRRNQEYLMSNLNIQTKIHNIISKRIKKITNDLYTMLDYETQKTQSKPYALFFDIVKGLELESSEKLTDYLFGPKPIFSPLPFHKYDQFLIKINLQEQIQTISFKKIFEQIQKL